MPNIRYQTLEGVNAFAYLNFKIELENQGLVLIRGLNCDEGGFLGAGKTSLFEIFSQLQTNRTGKHQRGGDRMSADGIINKAVGKDYSATLRMLVDLHPYEIQQYRAHSQYGTSLKCIDVNTGQNLIPTGRQAAWALDNLLKCDEAAFFHTIYITQEFTNMLVAGTDNERRIAIMGMFGLNVYDELYEKTKRILVKNTAILHDVSSLEVELEEIKTKLQQIDIEATKTEIQTCIAELIALAQQQQIILAEHDRAANEVRQAADRAALIAETKQLFAQGDFGVISIKEITEEFVTENKQTETGLITRIAKYKGLADTAERRKILQARLAAAISARAPTEVEIELNEVKNQLREALAERPIAETKVEIYTELAKIIKPKQALQEIKIAYTQALKNVEIDKAKIELLQRQLESGVCPTCHRAYAEDIDGHALQQEMAALRSSLRTAQDVLREVTSALKAAEQYQELTNRLKDLSFSRDLVELQTIISALQKQERTLVTELESVRQREKIEIALAELPEIPDDIQDKLVALAQRLREVKFKVEIAQKIIDRKQRLNQTPKTIDLAAAQQRLEALKVQLSGFMSSLTALSQQKATAELVIKTAEELQRRKEKIEKGLGAVVTLRQDVQCLDALKYCFGSNGLKLERFNAIMKDAVTNTVPQYARMLWPDCSVALDLNDDGASVKFGLHRQSGTVIESSLLSGGERHKAGLSLLLGLRDLREHYMGSSSNVLILDEPFGNLDPMGTQALLKILQTLSRRFGSVFVITHRPEVFSSAAWDQTWWAIREQGISTLYQNEIPDKYIRQAQKYADAL